MKFIDLCAGIGGFRLGLERAGMECAGYCEIDKFARKSYEAMFDTEGEWTAYDITKVTDEEIRRLGERGIQLICGGFPCQAFSIAGKRLGFRDARGTIIFHFLRFVRGIQPKWFVFENVKGLLSHDGGATFRTIIGALAELGYLVEWQVLNSKDFGVPQNRERVYIVGHLGDRRGRKIFPVAGADGEDTRKLNELTSGQSIGNRVYSSDGIAKCLAANGGGGGAKTGLYTVNTLLTIKKDKGEGSSGNLWVKRIGDETAAALTARYSKGLSADGCNGVICVQKTHGNTTTVKENETGTLQAARPDKVPAIIFRNGIRIRRLTPRECWRLQGLPDAYFDRAKAAGLSDTQLYKQAGNAVTVNVVEWIGKQIMKIEEG